MEQYLATLYNYFNATLTNPITTTIFSHFSGMFKILVNLFLENQFSTGQSKHYFLFFNFLVEKSLHN